MQMWLAISNLNVWWSYIRMWMFHCRIRMRMLDGCCICSGAMAQWHSGTVTQWLNGTVKQWHSDTVAQWHSGAMAQWHSGSMAQWHSDSVAQWRNGTVAQWNSGAVTQWRNGTVVQWHSGTVTQWHSAAVAWALDSRLREPGFKSCAAMSLWPNCFTWYCSSSLSYTNEYLAIDIDGYLCSNSFHALIAIWLDAEMVFNWTGLPGK